MIDGRGYRLLLIPPSDFPFVVPIEAGSLADWGELIADRRGKNDLNGAVSPTLYCCRRDW